MTPRFYLLEYGNFEAEFKGLVFRVKLITTAKEILKDKENEVFNVEVEHKGNKIRYEFNNSVMEKEISDLLKEWLKTNKYPSRDIKGFKMLISKKFMWGGYDKVKTFKELEKERAFNLLYSVLVDLAYYMDFSEINPRYADFCENFGYDEDSRKAEKIYNKCLEMESKVLSLGITERQKEYFKNQVATETDKFNKDLRKALNF